MINAETNDQAALGGVDKKQILIVEDEQIFARAVARRLEREGFVCRTVISLGDAETAIEQAPPDLVLLDIRLPDGSGLDFLERLRGELGLNIPVIVMTAYGEIDDAVAAMKLAASDFLKKPIDLDELNLTVSKVLENQDVSRQLAYSRAREARTSERNNLVGRSAPISHLREQIEKIARLTHAGASAPPNVLITGETGSGKDVTARSLHASSSRAAKPFVHVDCASLPKELIEAELFGHEKGAFTNAHVERTGLIEMAEDGVLFLDEFGELPLDLQSKLLAVLERRVLRRIGSGRERKISAWFIAATNRDVVAMVDGGSLRADLYFRLNVLSLEIPPLRERVEDIDELVELFAEQTTHRYAMPQSRLSESAADALRRYDWPGNVRELRHVIERATLLSGDGLITHNGLMLPNAASVAEPNDTTTLIGLTLDEAERSLIVAALARCESNVSAAARELGITRMAMRYRMKKYNLEPV